MADAPVPDVGGRGALRATDDSIAPQRNRVKTFGGTSDVDADDGVQGFAEPPMCARKACISLLSSARYLPHCAPFMYRSSKLLRFANSL